jgi:hypothetical protein
LEEKKLGRATRLLLGTMRIYVMVSVCLVLAAFVRELR